MNMPSLLRRLGAAIRWWVAPCAPARPAAGNQRARPGLERLEERCVPAGVSNPAAVPAPLDPAWLAEADHLAAHRGDPTVVFLGDSILARFERGPGLAVWRSEFAPLGAGDLAVGRSKTQNVLWQIDQGLLDGLSPRVVVLLIGTNNLSQGYSPEEVAGGVAADVGAIEARLPQARVLLLAILPRGADPHAPIRTLIAETNPLLSGVASEYHSAFLDAGPALLGRGGTISPSVLHHALHPTAAGYKILAGEIRPAVLALLAGA